jgi:hypothetical protein
MPKRPLLPAVIAACVLAACGGGPEEAADHARAARRIPRELILPEQGMAGVRLAATRRQVLAVLGRPDEVRRESESETGVPIKSWRYVESGLTVDLHRRGTRFTVGAIRADRAPPRTAEGVGVGSTDAAVSRTQAPLRCGRAGPGRRECWRGSEADGGPQTVFRLRRGRVYEVEIVTVFR